MEKIRKSGPYPSPNTKYFFLTWIYYKTMHAVTQLSDMQLIRFFSCEIFFPNLEQLNWKKKRKEINGEN
jgi:hypothetical protein